MPIIVKDYTWQETEGELIICLPLKGVSSTKVDIFSTDQYIKASYPPYLFELHLFKPVTESQSTAQIGKGVINFRLVKKEPTLWGRLHSHESEDKEAMVAARAEAVAHSQRVDAELREERARKKREEEQYAIQQQMKQEQEERDRIEKEKQEERNRATRELEEWKADEQRIREKVRQRGTPTPRQQSTQSPEEERGGLPPPRHNGKIQISFTPRPFATPSRESKAELEEDYLARMAAARKIKDPEKKDENINEKNPEFLKDRGVEFFKAANYQAAINVFSQAISLNDSLPHLFSNRAACYLATGDNERCIADCSRALELFFPVVPSNYIQRAKAFARRGTAYTNLAQLDLAVQDYGAAVKLVPGDEKLKDDYERLKTALINDHC